MSKLKDNKLDNAFRTLVSLLGELGEQDFSASIDEIYQELATSPSYRRVAVLRACLRSKLATRPGGIGDMYFETDGTKNVELMQATDMVRSFARMRLRDLLYLRSIR